MSKKTYRVKVRERGFRTYEIDAENKDDACEIYAFGRLVYDDLDEDGIESVVEIDIAEGGCSHCGHPVHVEHCMERVAVMDGLATIGSRLCTCPDPQRVGR